jgi:hypothetical protein
MRGMTKVKPVEAETMCLSCTVEPALNPNSKIPLCQTCKDLAKLNERGILREKKSCISPILA